MTPQIPAARGTSAGQPEPLAQLEAQGPPSQSAPAAGSPARVALESLAAALDPADHVTALVTGGDRPPRLAVTSRRTRLCDDIYAAHGWFWWSSAERIAPTSELSAAARAVSASLRGLRVLRDQM